MHPSRHPARAARTRGRGRAALLLVGLVAVGAAGCSQPAPEARVDSPTSSAATADAKAATQTPKDAGTSTHALAGGSSFLVSAPSNFFQQAIVSGRLALIGDNCVGLDMEASGESAALTFPHGTRPSADGGAIVLPDGLQVRLGDSITGGGGYLTLSEAPDAFEGWPDVPSGCGQATYLANIYDVSIGEGQ